MGTLNNYPCHVMLFPDASAWAPAGGGKSRRSPPPGKKIGAILGAFLLLFLHMRVFFILFLSLCLWGAFFTMWGPFCSLFSMVGTFFGLAPPSKISASALVCHSTIPPPPCGSPYVCIPSWCSVNKYNS